MTVTMRWEMFPRLAVFGFIMLMYSRAVSSLEPPTMQPLKIPLDSMRDKVTEFGEEVKMLTLNLTNYNTYSDMARKHLTVPKKLNPQDLVDKFAREIEELLETKVKAIERLVIAAENAKKEHEYRKNLQLEYVNNKKVLSPEDLKDTPTAMTSDIYAMINLTSDNLFNEVKVNPNYSTVHVPTNVYDQAPVILNGIKWSKKLDPVFKENRKEISDLRWQYFCNADGFLRVYPGIKWPIRNEEDSVDMYDCRVRSWYIKAASSSKNIVILVDTSGSMKGRRRIITGKTIQKLLETLSDDDHFNIIRYSDKPEYLDSCFNGTLMQANIQNKQNAVKLFRELEMKQKGELNLALEEAFKLFENNDAKNLCNKAIMLITDGPAETYREIFDKHNWPNKTVRLFSFLVGREVKENRYAKWMACANKGYYTHISTLADVQESVQYYLRVLSRPMGIARKEGSLPRIPKWTPVYADYSTEVSQNLRKGVGLVTSVSMPVFDTSNMSTSKGSLLGVMGTDVPIQEIKDLVPKDKLGANAYAFMYTHHGYVLFHPNMKPMYQKTVKYGHMDDHKKNETSEHKKEFRPFYNTIDITEMEYAVNHTDLHKFRQKLLSASNRRKPIRLKVKVPYDRMNRVEVVDHLYYTASIKGTPFKVALALPSYSTQLMLKTFDSVCANVGNKQKEYEFAPWRYCGNNESLHATGVDRKLKILDLYKCVNGKGKCQDQDSILYSDLLIHHDMMKYKIADQKDYRFKIANALQTGSEYSYGHDYKKYYDKMGVELLFFATRGGLTDFVVTKSPQISPYWMGNRTETVQELYYRQAIMNKEEKKIDFTFSIPINEEFVEGESVMTILSTIPVYVGDANVAVAGMLQNFTTFTDILKKHLYFNDCKGPECFSCEYLWTLTCYLLDENGYILYGTEGVEEDIFP
ncbi:voltage-dependent calcium channel subunit alpha-2/delta-3-like [Saccostrea cucullata]|uniref:voltage-dependent calcium channel subunit alpha-2/delta-3-like n=1 Tax=Saccostrea cuccullata TaxID=36930 RepID=UPI002ED68343